MFSEYQGVSAVFGINFILNFNAMKKINIIFQIQLASFCFANAQQVSLIQTIKYSDFTFSNVMTADKAGNIFMSGHYRGTNGVGPKGIYIHKYSASDNLVWKDTASGTSTSSDFTGLAVDKTGNAYFSRGGKIRFENEDYEGNHLIKYNPNGQIQWLVNSTPCFNVAVDNSESIYVAANNINKYNSSGNCIGTIGLTNNGNISLDNSNNFYLVTSNSINKHSAAGNLLWSYPAMFDSKIAIDATGNCYLSETGSGFISPLTKLDPSGNKIWTINLPFYGAYALYCDSNNDILIVGIYGVGQAIDGVEMRKISGNGSVSWSYKLPDSAKIRPTGIIEKNGAIYMSATRAFYYDACLYKIDPPNNGTNQINEVKNSNEISLSLSPNPSRGLFAVSFINDKYKKSVTLDIYDIGGKCVYNKYFQNSSGEFYEIIDLNDLPAGIYSLEASSDKYYEMKRMVVE